MRKREETECFRVCVCFYIPEVVGLVWVGPDLRRRAFTETVALRRSPRLININRGVRVKLSVSVKD